VTGSPLDAEAQAPVRIDIDEVHDLLYWTARLGCTSRQLRQAIRAAGPYLSDVVAWLRRQEAL
jgi:hypothetical protein